MRSNTLEVWGGIECSYTRVKDSYGDQLDYCGHYRRGIEDIQMIADLGFKALRYPIIWERYGSSAGDEAAWTWLERQLNTLRYLKITPIAGLVHHGSGPIHATLMDAVSLERLKNMQRRSLKDFLGSNIILLLTSR